MKRANILLLATALLAGGSATAAAQDWRGGAYGQDRDGAWSAQHDRDAQRDREREPDRDNGYYRNSQYGYNQNSAAFQQGWRDGQEDARRGRTTSSREDRYRNQRDRADYDAGYSQGYQAWVNNNTTNNNGTYGNGNNYPNNGRWGRKGGWHGNGPGGRRNGTYGNGTNGNGTYGNGTYGNGTYGNGAYGNNAMNTARDYGYRDGMRDGQSDRATGHSFRPTQDDAYRNASDGYNSSFGDRDQYKAWFRSAYEQGYQRGYNGNGYSGR